MAAYAALVSLEHIIDNLQLHCRPPIVLHKEQVHLLTQKVTFLQQFHKVYSTNLNYSKEADPLETRIVRAAYAAEDAIESHIFDQLNNNDGEKVSSDGLYKALEMVIQDMVLIKKEATEINKETDGFKNQMHAKSTTPADSSGSTSPSSIAQKKIVMVGADDLLLEMKDKLTSSIRDLQTIPIVGMGGSGKTTLALNIYHDGLIKEHFDFRAWVTISQEYSILEILIQLLTQLGEPSQGPSEGELEVMLHKHLYGRKYIIILDDMWNVEAWDGVKRFLPNNKNGSRIVITTRLTTLALSLPNSNSLGMKLLDEDASWELLSKTMFGLKGCCPSGFQDIGKKIGKSCKGLPLSIVVVGGLLARSEQTIEFWENMEENLNEIVNLDDNERCLKTLYMSYKQLPIHLQPCFLYMGVYREDHVIRVSSLIKLWVAEGFLKPISGKRPEDVARAYLKDLIDRNLILIHEVGSIGSIKECRVHDLLRDLCLREAKKQGFYTIYRGQEIRNGASQTVVSSTTQEINALSSESLARSLILDLDDQHVTPLNFRLLRIVSTNTVSDGFLDNVHQLVNSRLLNFTLRGTELPSSIWLFWNLQTITVSRLRFTGFTVSSDIWYMSHIRHLYIENFHLPEPPPNFQANGILLANLQSLGKVGDFKCSEQMVKIIPNIRKLKIYYEDQEGGVNDEKFCLTNLGCLDKLESLNCNFKQPIMWRMNYPQSLKKLSLRVHRSQCWQGILDKIGDLPLLQKLDLNSGTFEGQWETTYGQFRSLKFLSLWWCKGVRVWTTEASHFPRLEHLDLFYLDDLEIPSDFAEITTLRLISIDRCSNCTIVSAMRILEEQESLYGEGELQVQVAPCTDNNYTLIGSFRINPNFHVSGNLITG